VVIVVCFICYCVIVAPSFFASLLLFLLAFLEVARSLIGNKCFS
jgi:hypothetical protein